MLRLLIDSEMSDYVGQELVMGGVVGEFAYSHSPNTGGNKDISGLRR